MPTRDQVSAAAPAPPANSPPPHGSIANAGGFRPHAVGEEEPHSATPPARSIQQSIAPMIVSPPLHPANSPPPNDQHVIADADGYHSDAVDEEERQLRHQSVVVGDVRLSLLPPPPMPLLFRAMYAPVYAQPPSQNHPPTLPSCNNAPYRMTVCAHNLPEGLPNEVFKAMFQNHVFDAMFSESGGSARQADIVRIVVMKVANLEKLGANHDRKTRGKRLIEIAVHTRRKVVANQRITLREHLLQRLKEEVFMLFVPGNLMTHSHPSSSVASFVSSLQSSMPHLFNEFVFDMRHFPVWIAQVGDPSSAGDNALPQDQQQFISAKQRGEIDESLRVIRVEATGNTGWNGGDAQEARHGPTLATVRFGGHFI